MNKSILLTIVLTAVFFVGCSGTNLIVNNADSANEDSILLKGTRYIFDERGMKSYVKCYEVESYRDVELTGALSEKLIDAGYVFAIKVHVAEDCKMSQRVGTNFEIKLKEFNGVSVYFPINMGRCIGDKLKAGTEVMIAYSPKAGSVLLLNEKSDNSIILSINSLDNKSQLLTSHVIDLMKERDAELIICDVMNQHTLLNQTYTSIWYDEFNRVLKEINNLRNVPSGIKKKVNAVHGKLKPLKATLDELNSSLAKELEDMNNDAGLSVASENMDLMRAHCLWASHILSVFRRSRCI
jgi:hypothetical protein